MLSKIFDDNSKIIPINAKSKETGNGYFKNEQVYFVIANIIFWVGYAFGKK